MSEKDKYLQEFLTCKFCDIYFLDPVLLIEHVKQKIEENDSLIYKCDFCNGNHEVPENGFIMNQILIDMLNKNVHLDGRTKTAIKVFDDLEILNKDVDLIKKDPENFIYDYFAKEKNKIDLKRETLFAKINDISDKMIDKIKQMEIDSKSNLKEKQNLIDSNFDYKKLTGQVLEWKEEIRNPQLNNDRLEKIIDESSDLLKQMENQSFEAKNKILNEKGCYFSPIFRYFMVPIAEITFVN